MRHKPRFHSANLGGWHHHQGDDTRYADDDCPHCRKMYLEEVAPDLLAACESLYGAIAVIRHDLGTQFPALAEAWTNAGAIIAKARGI